MEQDTEPKYKPTLPLTINLKKGGKNIKQRKDSHLNKCCWENWTDTCKRMQLEHSLTPCKK